MSDIVFDGMVFDRLRQIGDQSNRIAALESEVARLRLTDAELEALGYVRGNLLPDGSREGDLALDAICGLLKRNGTLLGHQ